VGPRAPRGGGGAAGAPPLTRLAACHWGILWPGFSNSMPGSKRVQRGFPIFSGESIILPRAAVSAVFGLCRDKAARLAGRPAPIGPPGGPQAGSQPGNRRLSLTLSGILVFG
jgi:hypothetical protein